MHRTLWQMLFTKVRESLVLLKVHDKFMVDSNKGAA